MLILRHKFSLSKLTINAYAPCVMNLIKLLLIIVYILFESDTATEQEFRSILADVLAILISLKIIFLFSVAIKTLISINTNRTLGCYEMCVKKTIFGLLLCTTAVTSISRITLI